MKKIMLMLVVSSTIIVGCSKEELVVENATPNNSNQTNENIPLAVGNYWVYETYRIDTLGNETLLTTLDSAYVSRDTTYNGNTYYVIGGGTIVNHVLGKIIRNSENTILSLNQSTGEESIVFTLNNIGSVFKTDTLDASPFSFEMNTKVNPGSVLKNVGAGSYNCFELTTEIIDLVNSSPLYPRDENRYYNSSVGLVAGQYLYMSSPDVFELRLLRYQLN